MLHSPCIQVIHWGMETTLFPGQRCLRKEFRATEEECLTAAVLQKRAVWSLDVQGRIWPLLV